MRRPPTDLEILRAIYNHYYDHFVSFDKTKPSRSSKIYVPIDVDLIARGLQAEPDIVFGRLYYDLDKRYGYAHDSGADTHFFALRVGDDINCIHFPYLASVLADMQERHRNFWVATIISVVSLAVSVVALFVSMFA